MNAILIEASDENTPPKRLREIFADYQENEIKKTLTSNPNTPLDILLKLGGYYPTELLKNPALDLYLLSNPNLLMEMPQNTLINILKLPQAPQEFITFALNNRKKPPILAAIISNHPKYKRDLSHADLSHADLINLNLRNANLRNANLKRANLSHANLSHANLSHANLSHANLTGADLKGANFKDANLIGANLTGADLEYCFIKNPKY